MINSHTVYDIGLKRDTSSKFKGHIKDLAVFGKALSPDEINRFYSKYNFVFDVVIPREYIFS